MHYYKSIGNKISERIHFIIFKPTAIKLLSQQSLFVYFYPINFNMMRPQSSDYPTFYNTYIVLAEGDNVNQVLRDSLLHLETALYSIPHNKADYAYAEDKWTIKQVLQHCIDTERIFAYRALCHARGEQQPLPGFEQNDYAAAADISHRSLEQLVSEFMLVRKTTVFLFESFTSQDLESTGFIGENPIKTGSWGYIIAGHWNHHWQILITKYL